MSNVFITAQEARLGAVNNQIIYAEIRTIECAILCAVASGKYSISLNNTIMTSSTPPTIPPDNTSSSSTDNAVIPMYDYSSEATGLNYFRVWKCLDCGIETTYDQIALLDQMNQVIKHFKDLGYVIDRRITSNTDTTFYWKIMW